MRYLILAMLSAAAVLAQPIPQSGPCKVTGSQTSGYVLTATDGGSGCSWQSVGSASVDATTLKNAEYAADSSVSANTITVSTTTAFPTLAAGQLIRVKVANTNTGATTMAIGGGSSKSVTKFGATALASGNLVAGTVYLFAYDGTEWQVVNPKLLAADIPTLNQNTSGTASNLSGTPALPNGTTATTQSQADASIKLATTAYVDTGLGGKAASNATTTVAGSSCALGSTCAPASTGLSDGATLMKTAAPPIIISQATTFYVCPSSLSNCAYNSDGGQSASPSDSNTYAQAQAKGTPWATIAHAQAVLATASLLAPVTIQLADTSTSCFQDTELIWQPITQGNYAYNIFEVGFGSYTDVYPQSYIEFKGNISTPANVRWVGAATCGGTTSVSRVALRIAGANSVVHGISFLYWNGQADDTAPVTCTDGSTCFVDNMSFTGDGNPGHMALSTGSGTNLYLGPNLTVTNGGFVQVDHNSVALSRTPAGWMTLTASSSTYTREFWLANEGGHITIWGGTTETYTGNGAAQIYGALARATLDNAQASGTGSPPASVKNINMPNATYIFVGQHANVYDACGATNNTCRQTSGGGTATYAKRASVNTCGTIQTSAPAGSGADTITTGCGSIVINPFGTIGGTQKMPGTYILGQASAPNITAASGDAQIWSKTDNTGPFVQIGSSTNNFLTWAAASLTSGALVKGLGNGALGAADLTGDATTSGSLAVTVPKVNGTSVPTNSAADQMILTTASATGAWANLPVACNDGSHTPGYDSAAHAWTCNSITGTASSPTFPVNAKTTTYQALAADFSACKTITVASGTFTVTLVASGSQPSTGQCIWVINYGSGVVTIARSGQNINGAAANLTLAAASASAPTGAFIVSDGTNYFGQIMASSGGSVSSVTGGNGVASSGGSTPNITLVRTIRVVSGTDSLTSADCGNQIQSTSTSSFTETFPQAGTSSMIAGCVIRIINTAAPSTGAIISLATTTSTFSGAAPFIGPGTAVEITSDGTNYIIAGPATQVLYSTAGTTDTVTCIGSMADTAFASTMTLPANLLTTVRAIRITLSGQITAVATVPAFTGKLKAGGTTIYQGTASTPPAQTNGGWGTTILIHGTAAAGGSAAVVTEAIGQGNTWTGGNQVAGSQNLATNGTLVLGPTLVCSAAGGATNSETVLTMVVEMIN